MVDVQTTLLQFMKRQPFQDGVMNRNEELMRAKRRRGEDRGEETGNFLEKELCNPPTDKIPEIIKYFSLFTVE